MSTPSCGWRLEARGVTSVVFQIPPSFIVHIPGRGRRFVSVTWPHYLHIYTYLHIHREHSHKLSVYSLVSNRYQHTGCCCSVKGWRQQKMDIGFDKHIGAVSPHQSKHRQIVLVAGMGEWYLYLFTHSDFYVLSTSAPVVLNRTMKPYCKLG